MLRDLIAVTRSFIVGPSLEQLARLKPSEVANLVAYGIDHQKLALQQKPTTTPVDSSHTDGKTAEDFEQLRSELSILRERVEVLERLVHK